MRRGRRDGGPAGRARERGSALVWALVLLSFAASLSALLLERGRAVDAAARTDLASLKAFYAAEGGLALARHRLAADPAYAGETLRVGECEVVVRVEARGTARLLVSESAGRRLRCTVDLTR
jgi:type II secretory pathway component PulK